MEEGPVQTRYWCHMCSHVVDPIMGVQLKCPFCESGFVEEMESSNAASGGFDDSDLVSDRALSLWAPILLGIMGNVRRQRGLRRHFLHNEEDNGFDDNGGRERPLEGEIDIFRRQRRSSATLLKLLQSLRAGIVTHSENHLGNASDRASKRERVIFINPFHQTIVVQGSPYLHLNQNQNNSSITSLGDYFIGPGLDLLLQHLAENDPNRYGTPPARKEFVKSLPTVRIEESTQCAVCLDDFDHGSEAIEMPCKHKFHSGCLLPWLELHSSCPVCRFQLPPHESKSEPDGSRISNNMENAQTSPSNGDHDHQREETGNDNDRSSLPWPFSSLFSVSGPSNTNPSTMSSSSSSASSARAPGSASQADRT